MFPECPLATPSFLSRAGARGSRPPRLSPTCCFSPPGASDLRSFLKRDQASRFSLNRMFVMSSTRVLRFLASKRVVDDINTAE